MTLGSAVVFTGIPVFSTGIINNQLVRTYPQYERKMSINRNSSHQVLLYKSVFHVTDFFLAREIFKIGILIYSSRLYIRDHFLFANQYWPSVYARSGFLLVKCSAT